MMGRLVQLMVKRDVIGEEAFKAFKLLDLGDCIGVKGDFFLTKTEEHTVAVESWKLLSKSLLPYQKNFMGLVM